jgi:hypothetical protein
MISLLKNCFSHQNDCEMASDDEMDSDSDDMEVLELEVSFIVNYYDKCYVFNFLYPCCFLA